ncbi:Hypothetical predicted protein [Octopus vulgaris]|uniref:Reverse transcriptase RNase H-like domain-containing protein n=1 Tax=Octopus vulgaris TaxID=6645 RepID=A0AA36AT52_OCTVU|nr:Hypothetical predicted protein [Octopus vulgaris]
MLSHMLASAAVTVDPSDTAIRGVLEELINGQWQPHAFFSRQLRPLEQKCNAFDRELLAVHLGVRHFRYFLEGCTFTVFTVHKPLTFAMSKLSEPCTSSSNGGGGVVDVVVVGGGGEGGSGGGGGGEVVTVEEVLMLTSVAMATDVISGTVIDNDGG